jgi:DNA-binding protein HU-beta
MARAATVASTSTKKSAPPPAIKAVARKALPVAPTRVTAKAAPPIKAAAPKATPVAAKRTLANAAPASPPAKRAAAASKATPAKVIAINTKQLATAFGERHELAKKDAISFVEGLFQDIVGYLKGGARVRISGLGIIEVKSRPARMGRNPATGEAIQIKASKKITFRAAKELKEAV